MCIDAINGIMSTRLTYMKKLEQCKNLWIFKPAISNKFAHNIALFVFLV